MPIVHLHIVKGRSVEMRRKLADAITAAVSDILELERSATHVLIEEHERDNWAIGGELLSERQPAAASILPDLEALFGKPKKADTAERPAATAPRRKSPAGSRSGR